MSWVTIIRQRPSIGDCLLLAPLIRAIRAEHPGKQLVVVTDNSYMAGALPTIFEGIPGVDRIEHIPVNEWTTKSNRAIDPCLAGCPIEPVPYTVAGAKKVYDCNAAFMQFERDMRGLPPYGIAEFWLRHFGLYKEGMDLMPCYETTATDKIAVMNWLGKINPTDKPAVGIVLRAGAVPRDWDYACHGNLLMTWLYTSGYLPISIDANLSKPSFYGESCVGKQLGFVAALIERCKFIVTPDTGLLHLAQAVGTPQVALWGIMPPELRVKGYECVVVPKKSKGFCTTPEDYQTCKCRWTFQQWSCMRRLIFNDITEGVKEAINRYL